MKDYHASQRLDNGYCFVMDESNNPKLHVHDGVRLNGTKEIKGVKACNFYGPCTAYGFFVEDRLTVPALLQKYAINDGKLLQTYNRAGIHGDNELNSIMQAMSVPVAPGDVHIFLDVIEDLPVGLYPNYVYTNRWFNENKSRNEVQFLDFQFCLLSLQYFYQSLQFVFQGLIFQYLYLEHQELLLCQIRI